ncbi:MULTISPECIES: NUDIX hydrolase [Thermoanaerobacter]|uniref:NUDIX hydrolase n=2 Tax=Thermoanaerobacter TaxID=1754 RepID=B0K9F7_THEP3|nr:MULTISPECIES: NUDIX hydrolase [Thermoanaerobacter]ABY92839.1 NUDIX hydrolase [Thermoanaerobacter sp. X514]ABY94770.1 NUDIX hydrolase [Thermoanaerobacter pseudethanolicus ATCC 33223]ADV79719.1 NUDIX hydrolase [Thermoanaerobacter brockii subsp. finnii Ako-1]HBW58746.1 NUDIX hydrolase [Thermoanaerobacter sp.]
MEQKEVTVNTNKIFEGKIINLRVDEVKLPNGKVTTREIVEHPGGVSIVAVNEEGKILLVKQYRKPAEESLLEIPAGKLEKGEDPLICAKRELLEETGYEAGFIKQLITFYTTPGFSNEKMYLYFAKDLKKYTAQPDEDEFLEVYEYTPEELWEMILQNQIKDSKTIIGILYYLKMRNSL